MELQIEKLSLHYTVKKLSEQDIPELYTLCKGNPIYYKHMKTEPTFENLTEDLTALPPGKTLDDKFFVGFYEQNKLVAILDLITGYPDSDTAYIGWFMMNREFQGKGIGSCIVGEILSFLEKEHFSGVELGYIKGNEQAEHFWRKNGFSTTGTEARTENYTIVRMQRKMSGGSKGKTGKNQDAMDGIL